MQYRIHIKNAGYWNPDWWSEKKLVPQSMAKLYDSYGFALEVAEELTEMWRQEYPNMGKAVIETLLTNDQNYI